MRRSYTKKTVEEIIDEKRSETSLQRTPSSKFDGKWLNVQGTVSDIQEVSYGYMMSARAGGHLTNTLMFFSQEWGDTLLKLRRDDTFRGIGQIARVDVSNPYIGLISLVNCELKKPRKRIE